MKRIKVIIFWFLMVLIIISIWKLIFPTKNNIPSKLIDKTEKGIKESLEKPLQLKNIDNLTDKEEYNNYSFSIVIDLSKSVVPEGKKKENRDRFYLELIENIYNKYIKIGFNVNTYFFGTELVEIQPDDISNFTIDRLNYYKNYKSVNSSYRLDSYTDILGALESTINDLLENKEDTKEKYFILISDDIYDIPGGTQIDKKRQNTLKEKISQLENTSFIFYKYEGGNSPGSIRDYVKNNFAKIFAEEQVEFKNIASKLVVNIKNDIYFHDLTTAKGILYIPLDSSKIPGCMSVEGCREINNTISKCRFRAEFIGKGEKEGKAESLMVYPNDNLTYFNFNFVNDYRYFPIKIMITGLSFCDEKGVKVEMEDIINLNARTFTLEPEESEVWTLPVKISYEQSHKKSLCGEKESIQHLYFTYQLEFLINNNSLLEYLKNRLKDDKRFSVNKDKLYYQGEQLTFLTGKTRNGEQKNLIVKLYPVTFVTPLVCILLLILCWIWFFGDLKKKARLTGWQVSRNGELLKTTNQKTLRIKGDYNDKNGDVVIKATKYIINWIPFGKQSRDGITVYFRYPVSVLNKDGDVLSIRKNKIYLAPHRKYYVQMFEDIILKIE